MERSTEPTPDGQSYGYKCPLGHYCEEGTKVPTPCPAGTYNGQTGKFDSIMEINMINI